MGTSRRFLWYVTRYSVWRDSNLGANELVGDLVGSPIKGAVSGLSGSLFGYIADWNWNKWAGISYDASTTTMTIGGPNSSKFTSNSSPSYITINFDGLVDNGLKVEGNTVWHAGNDGASSGLDADLLDGMQPATTNTVSTIVQRDSSGNFSAGVITATDFNSTSDRRLKENIEEISSSEALEKILNLQGVYFNFKTSPDKKEIGFIAQDVKEIVPELAHGSEETTYSVSYDKTVSLLVQAIKEQQNQINQLKNLLERVIFRLDNK